MRYFLIFVFIFLWIDSYAQEKTIPVYLYQKKVDTSYEVNNNWFQMPDTVKKDGIWVKRYKDMEQKAVKGFYENGVRAHVWEFYLPDGKLQRLHYYQNGVKKYDIRFFGNNMELRKYTFISDSNAQITNIYAQDGQLKKKKKIENFENPEGKNIGYLKHYYPSGVIQSHTKYFRNYNPRKEIDSTKYFEIGELRIFPDYLITRYRENQKVCTELKLAEIKDTLFQYSIHYKDGSLKLLSYFKPSAKPGKQLIPAKTWFLWNEKGEVVRTKRFRRDE